MHNNNYMYYRILVRILINKCLIQLIRLLTCEFDFTGTVKMRMRAHTATRLIIVEVFILNNTKNYSKFFYSVSEELRSYHIKYLKNIYSSLQKQVC